MKDIDAQSKAKIDAIEKQRIPGKNEEQINGDIAAEKSISDARIEEMKAAMPKAIFPMKNPAVISMGLAFLVGILISLIAPEKEAEARFEDEKIRSYVGIGSE